MQRNIKLLHPVYKHIVVFMGIEELMAISQMQSPE